jgi:GPH family glycoside/pentoside/hexuronide:cation symporter
MSATMLADVCDEDEFRTGLRREGMYGAVFSLQQKIAYAVAVLLGGYLVRACGYTSGATPSQGVIKNLHDALILAPLILLGLAVAMVVRYPLTKTHLARIQVTLRTRRDEQRRQTEDRAPISTP